MGTLSLLYIKEQKSRQAHEKYGYTLVFCYPHWLSKVCVCVCVCVGGGWVGAWERNQEEKVQGNVCIVNIVCL